MEGFGLGGEFYVAFGLAYAYFSIFVANSKTENCGEETATEDVAEGNREEVGE